MKTRIMTWIAAFAFVGICVGQQSEVANLEPQSFRRVGVNLPIQVVQSAALPRGSAAWNAERQNCLALLRREFPEWTITAKGFAELHAICEDYNAMAKQEAPALCDNPWKALYFARLEKRRLELEAAQAQAKAISQAPVWKRFVQDENFRKANRDGIADEIRRQDGDAAAERFLREEQAKDMASNGRDSGRSAGRSRSVIRSSSETYQRVGDRITINGDARSGYRIKGNQLIDVSAGRATHVRSGDSWIPLDSSHPTIRDPN